MDGYFFAQQTPTMTSATTSAVVSLVKRPFHTADDTLPSPPHPLSCGDEAEPLLLSVQSTTSLSPHWVLCEKTGEDVGLNTHGDRWRSESAGLSPLDGGNDSDHLQSGRTAPLHGEGQEAGSFSAVSPSMGEAMDGTEDRSAVSNGTAGTPCGVFLDRFVASLTTPKRESAAAPVVPQSLSESVAAIPRSAGLQSSGALPDTRAKGRCVATSSAPSSISRGESRPTRSPCSGAEGITSAVVPHTQSEEASPEQHPAALSGSGGAAQNDALWRENEALRIQLESLGYMQEELVRRCQRHASERKLLTLEKEEAMAQLTEAYKVQLGEQQDAVLAAQSHVAALAKEVVELRSALAHVQEELRASMVEQLRVRSLLDTATAAKTRVEEECATWREATDQLEADRVANATAEFTELKEKLWVAEERAAAADLAFQSLCYQLAAAAASTADGAGAGVYIDPSAVREETVGQASQDVCPFSGDAHGNDLSNVTPVLFDESAVLMAVQTAMEKHCASLLSSSSQKSRCTLVRAHPHDSRSSLTAAVSEPSPGTPSLSTRAHLSNSALLHCRLHKKLISTIIERVSAGYQQASRTARLSAEASAAEMQVALLREVKELRAQLKQSQDQLMLLAECPRDDPPRCHGEEMSEHPTKKEALSPGSSINLAAEAGKTSSPLLPTVVSAPQAQHQTTVGNSLHEEAFTEAQRQLRHERSYIRHLQEELQSLKSSNYAASVLEDLTEALHTMRMSTQRVVRDAVAELQRTIMQEWKDISVSPISDRGGASEGGEPGDSESASHGRWQVFYVEGKNRYEPQSPGARANKYHYAMSGSPCSPLLDGAFMCSIHKSILRAEAHVEQVSAALRKNNRDISVNSCRWSEPHGDAQTALSSSLSPHYRRVTPLLAREPAGDLRHRSEGICPESPSRPIGERLNYHSAGTSPPTSPYFPTTTASTGQRSAQQEGVYREMRALLVRLANTSNDAVVSAVQSSRYSTDVCPLKSKPITPLPLPAGINTSPTSNPSPYVTAYVAECKERLQVASLCAQRNSFVRSTAPFSRLQFDFADLTAVTQELSNVRRLLDCLREAEETREERWRQHLDVWQHVVLSAFDGVLHKIEHIVAVLRPSLLGTVRAPCDTAAYEKDACALSSLRAKAFSIPADLGNNELEETQAGLTWRQCPTPQMVTRVVSPRTPSRLAEVLSVKRQSKDTGADSTTPPLYV